MKKLLSCSNLVSLLSGILIMLVCNFNLHAQQNKINTSEKYRKTLVDNQWEKIDGVIKKEVWSQIDESISEIRLAKAGKSSLKSGMGITAISETDSLIMVKLFEEMGGSSWTNKTNWLAGGPISSWYGVKVVGNNVTEIRLKKNNLTGTIPAELGQLTSLEYLSLDTNNLSGNIPATLGNLSNLDYLYLSGNQLDGAIPQELGNLNNLLLLYIAGNKLSGTIPVNLKNLSAIRWLDLAENELTGNIPVELGLLSTLEYLDLSMNKLSGSVPVELADLSALRWMVLSSNQLSGTIPTELGGMTNLELLYLNDNQLTGVIPIQLNNLSNLRWLNLGQNQLTNAIPAGFSILLKLELIYLNENFLTGSVPTELGSVPSLRWLNLGSNQFSGVIPAAIWKPNFSLLYLNDNELTGTIPSAIGSMSKLEWLNLNSNQLSGSIPVEISQLNRLKFANFDSNQLDELPDLTVLDSLSELTVSNNKFTFEDLEYNININDTVIFIYSPQDSIGTIQTITKNEEETFTYTITTGGTQNQYQWFKDGVLLADQTTETIEITGLTVADAGNYFCEVTNTAVPDLTLTSREITLLLNICYTRNFSAGWNIFSSPVMPADPDMETIFQPFISNESLIKIQDEEGNSLEKIFGNWNNNIGNMASTEGYKVKVSGIDNEIEICGPTVKYPYAIPLRMGWNIIGYPQTTAFDGKDVVQELIDKGVLIKIQDETGSSIEKLSDNWINNIGNFVTGEGYKVKVNAADTIWIYNNYPHIKSNNIQPELIPTVHYRPAFEGNGVDHMNIYLALPDKSGIMEDDEIGIFDGNICVGATKITKQNSSYISLIASAADGTADKANGFRNGGDIILKLYRNGKEYPMLLQPVNNALLKFEKNGSLIAMANTDLTTGIEITENKTSFNFYPNPFHENINIEINLQNEEYLNVEIYDIYSRKIKQLFNGKANETIKLQWDGNDERRNKVSNAVYFIRVNKSWEKVLFSGN